MNITLTHVTSYGIKYDFDDRVEIHLDDEGFVVLATPWATTEHFKMVRDRENMAAISWSAMLEELNEPEFIV